MLGSFVNAVFNISSVKISGVERCHIHLMMIMKAKPFLNL